MIKFINRGRSVISFGHMEELLDAQVHLQVDIAIARERVTMLHSAKEQSATPDQLIEASTRLDEVSKQMHTQLEERGVHALQ